MSQPIESNFRIATAAVLVLLLATRESTGEPEQWSNPQSANSGIVISIRDGTDPLSGDYCREFQQTVTINGTTQQGYATACRQPDGSRRVVGS